MHKPLYIDHQATTPVESAVLKAMEPYWSKNFGNPHSNQHIIGWNSNKTVNDSKRKIADFIGSEEDEIFFTSGATESNNLASFSLCDLSRLYPQRKRVLLSPIEHSCILNATEFWSNRYGLEIEYLKVDKLGYIDLENLEKALKKPTLFCSIGFVNNEIGTIQDLDAIYNILKEKECFFHSDCAQAPKTIDCQKIAKKSDLASFSGHKIGAPNGIGVLYINAEIQSKITPLLHGGGQQNAMRPGTVPVPLCVGMAAACELLTNEDAETSRLHTAQLTKYFLEELKDLDVKLSLNGPPLLKRHVGNLNVSLESIDASELLMMLQPNVCASTGSACSSRNIETSHVLEAIGLSNERKKGAVRFSFSHQLTFEQLDYGLDIIKQTVSNLS